MRDNSSTLGRKCLSLHLHFRKLRSFTDWTRPCVGRENLNCCFNTIEKTIQKKLFALNVPFTLRYAVDLAPSVHVLNIFFPANDVAVYVYNHDWPVKKNKTRLIFRNFIVGTKQTIITENASDKPTHLIRKSFNWVEEKKRLRWDVRNKDKLCALMHLIRLYTVLYEGF